MLTTIIVTALFFFAVISIMAVGNIRGKTIKGSCGGLANVGLDGTCGVCGRKPGEPGTCDKD